MILKRNIQFKKEKNIPPRGPGDEVGSAAQLWMMPELALPHFALVLKLELQILKLPG
jgi:hypothetical protein